MNYLKKNIIFILLSLFVFNSCQDQAELTMERGIQYYEWNKFDLAILEFKKVVHLLNEKNDNMNYEQIRLLSQAHHNLSISYSKKDWNNEAKIEAQKAFDLIPSNENRTVLDLLEEKAE